MTVGFIGAGNMGGALATAAAKKAQVVLSDSFAEKARALADKLGGKAADSKTVAAECAYIFLGVKPQVMAAMLEEIAPVLKARKDSFVLVSMAAGVKIEKIRQMAGGDYPVIRIMPNIPVSVGSGMILYDATENVSAEALAQFCDILSGAGCLDRLDEKLIDAGSAVSGCGPAFVSLFAEAMADGGVACGLPRDKALQYSLQTIMGTAKLLLDSGMHPGQLKDAVCSPGGSTIAGVRALEQSGFRAGAIEAVEDAFTRTKELGK